MLVLGGRFDKAASCDSSSKRLFRVFGPGCLLSRAGFMPAGQTGIMLNGRLVEPQHIGPLEVHSSSLALHFAVLPQAAHLDHGRVVVVDNVHILANSVVERDRGGILRLSYLV